MSGNEPAIRNISDTANWAAVYRARETERRDALFRDPLARRLAGERGEQIFATMPDKDRHSWAWVMRTYLFDHFVGEQVKQGVDMVINLAAGLDARPYRMSLPASLKWIEVDLPEILTYKEDILKGERPNCVLERVRLDLLNVDARRALLEQVGRRVRRALIITEGLLIYLSPEEVAALAQDLASPPPFQDWALDLASPGLLRLMQKQVGSHLNRASAPFKFGPEAGPGFFKPHGWRPAEVRSIGKTGARTRRAPFLLRLLSFLPESNDRQGSRPWGGVCLMTKQGA